MNIYGSNLYLFELNLGLVVRHGLVCSYMYPQIHCNIKKKRRVYLNVIKLRKHEKRVHFYFVLSFFNSLNAKTKSLSS